MSNREEMLMACLNKLDEINIATQSALEILETNTRTINMVMQEMVYGAQEMPSPIREHNFGILSSGIEEFTTTTNDRLEELANEVVEKIMQEDDGSMTPNMNGIGIVIDPEEVDPHELMNLVKRKLAGEVTNPIKDEGEFEDGIDFENPLE